MPPPTKTAPLPTPFTGAPMTFPGAAKHLKPDRPTLAIQPKHDLLVDLLLEVSELQERGGQTSQEATDLVTLLDRHPLAIIVASSLIRDAVYSPSELLQALKGRFAQKELLDTENEDAGSRDDLQIMPCIDVEDLLANTELIHAHEFPNRVRDTVCNRRAFQAKPDSVEKAPSKVMVGLVPRTARAGDVICILYGCSVPVVLRKPRSFSNDDTWLLVGDAYINGAMNGEEIKRTMSSDSLERIEREIKIK
ncbi:hypothetical protein LTR56_027334 [Elasticomyces elasticus]|nr:hypothetical protein LTR56_027334 [Elasticomyces elasticus]KAK4905022.1 hypothetical protein LTR49_025620 [Elasticomyces elasticus]